MSDRFQKMIKKLRRRLERSQRQRDLALHQGTTAGREQASLSAFDSSESSEEESQPENSKEEPPRKIPTWWRRAAEEELSQMDEHGRTALHRAAMRGEVQKMRELIAMGADVRLRDREGLTPLYWALAEGREEAADFLAGVDCGNDVADGGGRTPLHWAAIQSFARVATRLLDGGAGTRVRDAWGRTPLHLALGCVMGDVAELIVEADGGIDLRDERGRTPLHYAAHKGFKKIVSRLLQKDVNPHVRDDEGRYPIHDALRWGWDDAIPKMILSTYALRHIAVDWGEMGLAPHDLRSCLEELYRCAEEIRLLKKAGDPFLSYHDLATGHVSRVARRLPDEIVRGICVQGVSRKYLAREFPHYADLISLGVQSAHRRRVATDRCQWRFSRLSPELPPLPVTCTDVILLCLSEGDMGNFLRAVEPSPPK